MRRYIVFIVVSLALMLAAISGSAVSVAFPVIIDEYNTSLVIAGWALSAYQLVATIIMPLAGKISETLGRKTTFIIYTLLFTVGTVLSALAPNIYLLIGARVIQAAGGGGFLPCAAGIVSEAFPESRQRYIGFFSSIFPIGMIIGPNLGGWLVEAFGWRSIFWFNVPLGIAISLLAWWLLPRDNRHIKPVIDFAGAGLLFGAVTAFMFALTGISGDNSTQWFLVAISFTLSIALFYLFIQREKRAVEPIVNLDLLRKKPFLAANIFNFIFGAGALGIFSLIPFYLVTVYGMSILQSGLILTARSVGMMAASAIVSVFLVKWGYRRPMLTGTMILTCGLVLLALQPQPIDSIGLHTAPLLFIILGVCGVGVGISAPAANNACIELMPDRVATITGLRGMFRNLGSATGISITTALIHGFNNSGRAFLVVFLALALIMIAIIPAIYAMPSCAVANWETKGPIKKNST